MVFIPGQDLTKLPPGLFRPAGFGPIDPDLIGGSATNAVAPPVVAPPIAPPVVAPPAPAMSLFDFAAPSPDLFTPPDPPPAPASPTSMLIAGAVVFLIALKLF